MKIVWTDTFTVPPDESGGICGIKSEDSGQAMIMYSPVELSEVESDFFIRFHSWDEKRKHEFFRSLMGRKVKVTIETVD